MSPCTYLLPIRRGLLNRPEAEALRSYLSSIRPAVAEILVVDGSPDDVFAAHDELWLDICRHIPVNRQFGFLNDKVNGIHTGVRLAVNSKIFLADDDIRYGPQQIDEMSEMLDRFEVVRPQNYFCFDKVASANAAAGIPARMEAARMLINRATLLMADYPGTCAFRRETLLGAGEYDGDVLFDNEELIRHLARSHARIYYANDFFVRKRPPTFKKWVEQRPRQAYEDFGLRTKTTLFALLPLLVILSGIGIGIKPMLVLLLTIAVVSLALAAMGRARGLARKFFPVHVIFFAPLWILERSLSTYWAFYWLVRRGGYPFGGQLLQKGIGRDWIEGGRIASETVVASRSAK